MKLLAPMSKVCPPKISGVMPRPRLFRRLEEKRDRPVLWIHAPGGSGKSTLVASYLAARRVPNLWYRVDERDADAASLFFYLGQAVRQLGSSDGEPLPLLTPEHQVEVRVFAHRFFEMLYGQLPADVHLVFDDCHEVEASSLFQEILLPGILAAPQGRRVILISRNAPPPSLIRMRVHRQMDILNWRDLRLNEEETEGILRLHDPGRSWGETAGRLHAQVHGWVAGLVLLLEREMFNGQPEWTNGVYTPEEVYDYFAGEVFALTSPALRDFLLRTALLPEILPELVGRITGDRDAGRLLGELHRRNYFIEMHPGEAPAYRYHPLFRAFLLDMGRRELPTAELARVRRKAAAVLAEKGRLEEAAELLLEAEGWGGVARLVEMKAPELAAQGWLRTLSALLIRIPSGVLDTSPWLLFWNGICHLEDDFAGARQHFLKSLAGFQEKQEPAGIYLAWSGMVDSFSHEMEDWRPLDHWAAVFEQIRLDYPCFPSPEIEFRVVSSIFVTQVLRQIDEEKILAWAARLSRLLESRAGLDGRIRAGFFRALYSMWTGNYRKSDQLLQDLRRHAGSPEAPPLEVLNLRLMEALHGCLNGRPEVCRRAALDGLALAEKSGIRRWENLLRTCLAESAMIDGDLAAAQANLADLETVLRREGTSLERIYFHILSAWTALLKGRVRLAQDHIDRMWPSVEKLGSPFHESLAHLGLVQVLFLLEQHEEAAGILLRAYDIGLRMKSLILQYMCLLMEAHLAFRQNREDAGLQALRQALPIGRDQDYIHFIWWQPRIVAALCVRALQAGIEIDYVRSLVRRRQLVPETPPHNVSHWPWAIRVHTLGRFALEVEGESVEFSGKVQKKPLELLKILIALGGSAVSEAQVTDILWPEADGDTAHHSFKIALHRLRQLIGQERAVTLREGRLSLDRRYLWVDAWAFEQIIADFRVGGTPSGYPLQISGVAERVLALYRGPFLCGDWDKPWAVPLRERLRSRFLHLVEQAAAHWQQEGNWQQAVECCQRGLEADELSEELYRRLMLCLLQGGRRAEALTVYIRCRSTLAALVGVEPSPETATLYARIMAMPSRYVVGGSSPSAPE